MPDQSFRDELLGATPRRGPTKTGRGAPRRSTVALNKITPEPGSSPLKRVIEKEVIPRLLVSRMSEQRDDEPAVHSGDNLGIESVHAFTEMILSRREEEARALISKFRAAGRSVEDVLLDLMGPSAQLMGEYWRTDAIDFVAVTVGVSRLQTMMRDMCRPGHRDAVIAPKPQSILLASVPGDQHTFGVFLLEEMFRRDGWTVVTSALDTSDDLINLVAAEKFDVVGFSLGREELLSGLREDIKAVRESSQNNNVTILAGGICLQSQPNIAYEIGADGTALDGRGAVDLANQLVL